MRTIECTAATREGRLTKATEFLSAADSLTVLGDTSAAVIATNYVHAGIAAADVICCAKLGRHASGQSHDEARKLLRQAEPSLETALTTLLGMKTDAGYGSVALSAQKLRAAERAARKLVEAARTA